MIKNATQLSLWLMLSLVLLLAGTRQGFAYSSISNAKKNPQSILLLGDSLSASYGMKQNDGWIVLLNQMLSKNNSNYNLINASISGETTSGGLARFPSILADQDFDILLIELGGNDGLRGFPPKLMKNNLLQLIDLAQEHDIPVLLMEIRIPPNYGVRYNKMFADVFTSVAKETDTELLPFFIEQVATHPKLMQADGIHPTKEAQQQLAEIVMDMLDKQIK